MPSYQELSLKAAGQRGDRQVFQDKAVAKIVELREALVQSFGAPPEALTALPLKARSDDEEQVSHYVLTQRGLRFGLKIDFPGASVTYVAAIYPQGQRLLVQGDGRGAIDVSNGEGVIEWCDWIETLCEKQLDETLNGHISSWMAAT